VVFFKQAMTSISNDFKIDDYWLVNHASPLEVVGGQIIDIIIYERKIYLANKIKKDILPKAQQNNHCIVYEH
jgi:hypothetical protein